MTAQHPFGSGSELRQPATASMTPGLADLGFVTTERIVELGLARRNTRALLARGAREIAPGHYGFIVALRAAWLVGLWVLA